MKKQVQLFLLMLGAIFFYPISVLAHTGVTETTGFYSGLSHPIGGTDHFLAMVAVGLWAAQMGGKAIWAVPSAFVILMIFGGILAISGIQVPYVEEGVLVSVLSLGVLIAAAFRIPLITSATIVGIFALFHGYAHGNEMPLAIGMISYSIGFALGTALLHVIGIVGAIILQKMNFEKVVRFVGGAIALGGIYLAMT